MKIINTRSLLDSIKKLFVLLFVVSLVKSLVLWITEFMLRVFFAIHIFQRKALGV